MDQDQENEPIDIFVAKIQNDLLNEDELQCSTHVQQKAVSIGQNYQLLCEECDLLWRNQGQEKQITPIREYVETINANFRIVSEGFIEVQQLFQDSFVQDMLVYSIDQRLFMIEDEVRKMIDRVKSYKQTLIEQIKVNANKQQYQQFRQRLSQILVASNVDHSTLNQLLNQQGIAEIRQVSFSLTNQLEHVIKSIKKTSDDVICREFNDFVEFMQIHINFKKVAVKQPEGETLTQSLIKLPPQPEPKPQIQNNKDAEAIRGVVTAAKKSRDILKQMMQEHAKECKGKGHPVVKVKGGGSFGFSWTGSYGVSCTKFEELNLCRTCKDCLILNEDMHKTCSKLYQLDYRDGLTWWVEAWFLQLCD